MSEPEPVPFFDEEPPTRRSAVEAVAYARETEALLARGGDLESAQVLVETVRPPMASAAFESDPRLDTVVYLVVSEEELAWFPLESESAAIAEAVDGRATLRAVLERAGLSAWEGVPHVDVLLEMGIVGLR